MVLDIPLCRTIKEQKNRSCPRPIKEQKNMSFLRPKIWNKLNSNIKTAATTASFTHCLKEEIFKKLQEWAILLFFFIIFSFICLIFWKLIVYDFEEGASSKNVCTCFEQFSFQGLTQERISWYPSIVKVRLHKSITQQSSRRIIQIVALPP